MKYTRPIFFLLLTIILLVFKPVLAQNDAPFVLVLNAEGAVTPAMREYIERGLEIAGQRNADLVMLQLNTPGGGPGHNPGNRDHYPRERYPGGGRMYPRAGPGPAAPGRSSRWPGTPLPWRPRRPSVRPARWAGRAKT